MRSNDQFIHELTIELKKIAEVSFPKECTSCGSRYEDLEDFLTKTQSIPNAEGLFEALEREDMSVIDLIRNCSCGSTLMVAFSERRDKTAHGLRRRELFSDLLQKLVSVGVDEADARSALLKVVRGGRSDLLESYGLAEEETHSHLQETPESESSE